MNVICRCYRVDEGTGHFETSEGYRFRWASANMPEVDKDLWYVFEFEGGRPIRRLSVLPPNILSMKPAVMTLFVGA